MHSTPSLCTAIPHTTHEETIRAQDWLNDWEKDDRKEDRKEWTLTVEDVSHSPQIPVVYQIL